MSYMYGLTPEILRFHPIPSFIFPLQVPLIIIAREHIALPGELGLLPPFTRAWS